MSAWSIGARTIDRRKVVVTREEPAEATVASAQPTPTIDALITWIPGEVIAAYAAIILALQPTIESTETPAPIRITSYVWLIAGALFAAAMTFLGAWSKDDDLDRKETQELLARVVLATIAFGIWSFVVPGSWWYSLKQVADNQTIIPIIAGLVGAAFGLFAEGLVRRVGR